MQALGGRRCWVHTTWTLTLEGVALPHEKNTLGHRVDQRLVHTVLKKTPRIQPGIKLRLFRCPNCSMNTVMTCYFNMFDHRNGHTHPQISVATTTTHLYISFKWSVVLTGKWSKVAGSKNDFTRLYTNLGTADRKYNVGKKHHYVLVRFLLKLLPYKMTKNKITRI
jgi:hypothetical protein